MEHKYKNCNKNTAQQARFTSLDRDGKICQVIEFSCHDDEKICRVIEFSCPADINVLRKVEEKVAAYVPLIRNLQIMYRDYHFKMLPVVVGALGTIPNATKESLEEMKFSKTEINKLLRKLQNNSVRGTVNICKTFMKF